MKTATVNLLLAITAVGLASLVVVDQTKQEEKLSAAIAPKPPLTAIDGNAVRHIVLHNAGSPDIQLEKTAIGWQLTAPVQLPADLVEIGAITELLGAETHGDIDGSKIERAKLGLDPPHSLIELDGTVLAIGDIEPLKQSRYVEVNPGKPDARIRLINDFPPELVDGEFTDLANKALLPFEADIARIEVPGLVVLRRPVGPGWTSAPATEAATSPALQTFVDGWRSARAIATLPPLAESSGAAKADVCIVLADGSEYRYALIDKAGSRYLQRLDLPLSYQLDPGFAESLLKLAMTPTS
ncbi:hypothetical protein [Nevskia ramosa]|uniref:hypothetical protein n=1 Tax=Nevskia ramosa TaxID=64002 RepID=UPI002356D377|nr:hypothetical protein [Nevskia ramosa]